MSTIAAPKLNYAKIRNTQRKSNKSIHDLKEVTNLRYNQHNQDSEAPVPPTKEIDLFKVEETTPSTNPSTNELTTLLGQTCSSGNLDYINSLLKDQKSTASSSRRGARVRSHHRARSTRVELSQEHKSKHISSENSFHKNPSLQTACITTQTSTLKPDLNTEEEVYRVKNDKGSPVQLRNNMSYGDPHNTPTAKSGGLFGQFFKGDDIMRRSMSVEDLRFDRRGEKDYSKGSHDKWGKGMSKKEKLEVDVEDKGDFMSNLNSYINYFAKSEDVPMKKSRHEDIFMKSGQKGNQILRKELEAARKETALLKKQMDLMQGKMSELKKINKHLVKDLSELRLGEEEHHQRTMVLENQVVQLTQRKDLYKAKLLQAEELLQIERIDNENNLMALKKVLAKKIGNVLDQRAMKSEQNRSRREEDYIRSIIKEGTQQSGQKQTSDSLAFSAAKDKKFFKGGQNHRYDLPLNSQAKKRKSKESFLYDNTKNGILREEDMLSIKNENIDLSGSSKRFKERENSAERLYLERKQDILMSGKSGKKLSKNHQIKILQERLAELIDGNDAAFEQFDPDLGQKSSKKYQTKYSDHHYHQQNHITLRERENSFMQVNNNTPMRYEYYMNLKGGNMEGNHSGDETSNLDTLNEQ